MKFERYQSPNKQLWTRLTVTDLQVDPELQQVLANCETYFLFDTRTYSKLSNKRSDAGWEIVFGTINRFLANLDPNLQAELAACIGCMHHQILTWFQCNSDNIETLNDLIQSLGALLVQLDNGTHLCDHLREFVIADNLVIPETLKDAGMRAQDSVDLTFNMEEVIDLTVITLLCKTFSPIFSTLMLNLAPDSQTKLIETSLKELHCASIFSQLFDLRYRELVEKLEHYILHATEQTLSAGKIKDTPLTLFSLNEGSYSVYLLTLHLKSQLIARQFVNIDFSNRNGNLMAYIYTSVKSALGSIITRIRKRPTYTRKSEMLSSEGDGNISQLELDSLTSKNLCDVPMLITVAVDDCIQRYIENYGIIPSEYDQVLEYYERSRIAPTPINQALCNLFYGDELGGGRGIAYLKAPEYTKLVVLLQLILLKLDVNYQNLAHAMTMRQSSESRLTTVDSGRLILTVGATEYYKACKDYLDKSKFGATGRDWDNFIKKICDHLLLTSYVYNTAPWIWNWLDQDNINGKLIVPDEFTIVTMCAFYQSQMLMSN